MVWGPDGIEAALAAKFATLFLHLDERQRLLAIGAEARSLGRGGISHLARHLRDRDQHLRPSAST
jgi:hypothetical protein